MTYKHTNELINETSPYLLQHAHNPIHWKAWNDNTLAEAKEKNRLIIISVGYAACHWCHVMEHESFEDIEVAQVMNDNYINIKVDREERPDIDQVYMNAVQLLTGSGGWPLNVVTLPDGRPVWGGTYFRKKQWINTLNQIADLYNSNPEKLYEYATKLEAGIKALDIVNLNTNEAKFEKTTINNAINSWSQSFDYEKGGTNRAPKFMMPNNLLFLLREAYQNNHIELQKYVNITLTKIAYGGIFDHVGGGFSRYSVDDKWHIPHFEKMLYDNAQLVSLYSDAYLATKNPLYKEVVYETLDFVERELTNTDGTFYSSLDADSINRKGELEEGAFYVWTEKELKILLNEDFELFSDYYSINDYGFWEHDNYVLIRKDSDEIITKKHNITSKYLKEKIKQWKSLLLEEREKRHRPRLDDKILTSWNALMTKGYIDAYRVFNEERFLNPAKKNAHFIIKTQSKEDGGLNHNYKEGKSTINGYLEDYATTIEAFIALYENTLNEKWLHHSRNLTNYTLDHFFDETSKMFFFTSNQDTSLVSRTIEYRDNVIPASNSIMAKNLFKLSHYYNNASYERIAIIMLNNMLPELEKYPSAFSNWMDLMLNYTSNYYEVAIVGKHAEEKVNTLNKTYLPNKLIAGSYSENDLPLLKSRYSQDKTLIYVCVNKACKLPVSRVDQAIDLIK
ncbi:thioredoxin domain-containing protein [Pontimicrobium sp. SW4]|uniref:Thioredoxin domain-containing protein n=1 Tax=Pontimicrobium sp. SW4 TaxID=3153519 RepID=A0AAU7BS10_9FLAO